MALAQRPGARFFAAFYRWSRQTQRSSVCVSSSQYPHTPSRLAAVAQLRAYHATRRLHEEQSIHGFLQPDQTGASDLEAQDSATVDPEQLKTDVRHLMRKVPASVAVITVAHYDPESNEHVPMGIAVSSLNTVTLDPPTVSFNVKHPSKALDAIRAAQGRFRVHFLEGSQMSRKTIEHFCNGNHPAAYKERRKELRIHVPHSETSPPQIQGRSVRAAAECTLTQEMTVGDHVVLVAQVNALETKDAEEPTVVYVDGTYRSLQSAFVIGHHGAPHKQAAKQTVVKSQVTDPSHELAVVHDYPLLPGQQDRHDYAERLKVHFKGTEIDSIRDFMKQLQPQTRQISYAFGVDLEALLYLCKTGEQKKGQEIFPEFYGQLSAAQQARLIDRAKALVKADARFLAAGYPDLLRHINVQIGRSSLLPSDILNPLRAEGLVGPFQEDKSVLQTYDRRVRNIFYMEQAEHALRQYLLTLTDKEILRTSLPVKLERAGINIREVIHLQGVHTRLKVETCSTFYAKWKIDITGDVTPEEARVVIQRLIKYLNIDRKDILRTHLREEPSDMMRNVNVHPLITGIDTTFLISKIQHLFSTTQPYSAFQQKVEEMLQPHFASSVTWEDLEARITHFVQNFPLRATTWKIKDLLPAAGLRGKTTLITPLSSDSQTLDESGLVETLVAKALKSHYGKGTDEENEAIAIFLREQYGFDVVSKSAAVTPEQALARSSADDLEAARVANEEVLVPVREQVVPIRKVQWATKKGDAADRG